MTIKKKELYHGAILAKIVNNPDVSLKLIERAADFMVGMYKVSSGNKNYIFFMQYRSNISISKDKSSCRFVIDKLVIQKIQKMKEQDSEILIALICGTKQVCLLTENDLLYLGVFDNCTSGITVSWSNNTQLTVAVNRNELNHRIARSALDRYNW